MLLRYAVLVEPKKRQFPNHSLPVDGRRTRIQLLGDNDSELGEQRPGYGISRKSRMLRRGGVEKSPKHLVG